MSIPDTTPDIPQCQHIKINGVQCGSPALNGKHLCYFHDRMRAQFSRSRRRAPLPAWSFPLLEDANSVQCALMQTIDAIVHKKLDRKTAALLLYGLQTASINLRHLDLEPKQLQKDAEPSLARYLLSQLCENVPASAAAEVSADVG